MSKNKRQIEKEDLIPSEIYSKSRRQIRKDLVEFKKNRRIALGPYATFYFESFETMLAQVQEMPNKPCFLLYGISLVKTSAMFVLVSSLPTRMIPAATASRQI